MSARAATEADIASVRINPPESESSTVIFVVLAVLLKADGGPSREGVER
jgi:hypothetical protein